MTKGQEVDGFTNFRSVSSTLVVVFTSSGERINLCVCVFPWNRLNTKSQFKKDTQRYTLLGSDDSTIMI